MKSVLITGAAGGLGRIICKELNHYGYKVIATDFKKSDSLKEMEIEFIKSDLNFIVNNKLELEKFKKKVISILGNNELYAIINNAAFQKVEKFEKITIEDWNYTLSVNLLAPIILSKTFLEELKTNRGTIINISSIHSSLTKQEFSCYATSKAALTGLTKSLAIELGKNIRVNAIEPAAIDTDMLRQGFQKSQKLIRELEKFHPSEIIGNPIDICNAVLFLLDPTNKFLNGSILQIGGGIHHRLHDPF